VRVGVARESFAAAVDPAVRAAVEKSVSLLRSSGAAVYEFDLYGSEGSSDVLPSCDEVLASYYAIATSEAVSNLARFDGLRYGRNHSAVSRSDEASSHGPTSAEWMQDFIVRARTLGFSDKV
jgi:aspartyl-tRNA(Asn)/glutamyl-tRNA(Gln) amidotransferase subunit A